ncbi:MAG: hypothetical protein HN742_18120 [Lentisphaerae bacterium]|jgi:hypothetical protein|nr:hypothetical protein [Lentisphaerota bacterium]MBT4823479.1 hypothetical protein [Lentisphaerota bacterium]MBT5611821.1 hypothetical protein [Lentisphaerota bacterium]MBT7059278.1 hypothetical protein [Lentisphaerota bacterium]MBT7843801.1 hypothetical protein [Lentisphaerota bacterium]
MQPNRAGIGVLLLLLIAAGAVEGGEGTIALVAGRETVVDWKPVEGAIRVYLPANYDTETSWPVVFFYHGLSGKPTTELLRQLTDGEDVILVGMTYTQRGEWERTPKQQMIYLRSEVRQLGQARTFLMKHASVDEDRMFLAGVSKGGWHVMGFTDGGLKGWAGAIILLAGRHPSSRKAQIAGVEGKPVYLGAGETDANNSCAQWAAQILERSDALVTWEEYAGRGHALDPQAPRLRAWLDVHVRRSVTDPRPKAKEWLTEWGRYMDGLNDDLAMYRALKDISGNPYFLACPKRTRRQIVQRMAELEGRKDVKREARAERDFKRALRREMLAGTLAEHQSAIRDYKKIIKDSPNSHFATQAIVAADRIDKRIEPLKRRMAPPMPRMPTVRLR